MSLKTFKNTDYTKRDYDCTNVVACTALAAPSASWAEADDDVLVGLTRLYIRGGISYYGHL